MCPLLKRERHSPVEVDQSKVILSRAVQTNYSLIIWHALRTN